MEMKNPKLKTPSGTKPQVLATLDYVSSENLRTSYLTGLFAAPTPEGSINVVGYVERKGFPEQAVVMADPDGQGGLVEDSGRTGWVREIQSSFLIGIPAAKALIEVLQDTINELQDRKRRPSND